VIDTPLCSCSYYTCS